MSDDSAGGPKLWTDQISVDEAIGLQVLHALAYIQAETEHWTQAEAAPPQPEEIEQTSLLHELSHNEHGLLLAAHSIELHQFRVGQFPGENWIVEFVSLCEQKDFSWYFI